MNHQDKQRVEEIVNLWLRYVDGVRQIEEIAVEGPTVSGMMVDFEGQIPQSSNYKVDGISLKVDKCKKIVITKEQIYAHNLLERLPAKQRHFITLWPQVRKRSNPVTRSHFTRAEVALSLNCSLESYVLCRKIACQKLIYIDKSYVNNKTKIKQN